MASFTLQPCKIREDRFVPVKDTAMLTVDWGGLCKLLAPHRTATAMRTLAQLKIGAYVGLRKTESGGLSCFVLHNQDMSGDARVLVRSNPALSNELKALYRVEKVTWDRTFIEAKGRPDPEQVAPTVNKLELLNAVKAPVRGR